MNKTKKKFKQWLAKTIKSDSRSSIRIYSNTIDKICKECFVNKGDGQNFEVLWSMLAENIVPITEKYYEFSNKGYLLDKITIWNALGYFQELISDIYQDGVNFVDEVDEVSFYLYDGESKLLYDRNFIASVRFKNLYNCLKLFNRIVFQKETVDNLQLNDEEMDFLNGIKIISKKMGEKNLDYFALEIVYNKAGKNIKNGALKKYCQYLYNTTKSPMYCLQPSMPFSKELIKIKRKNPKKLVDGNFEETRHLTGEHAAQVIFMPHKKIPERTSSTHVLTHNDLTLIFRIDRNTVYKLYDRFNGIYKGLFPQTKTILGGYYSVDFVNACLVEYHHYDQSSKVSDVDYTKSDYKKRKSLWFSKDEALRFIGIKKQAFENRVKPNCPYIDYAEGAPKYYFPYLKYVKEVREVRSIRFRKNNKIN